MPDYLDTDTYRPATRSIAMQSATPDAISKALDSARQKAEALVNSTVTEIKNAPESNSHWSTFAYHIEVAAKYISEMVENGHTITENPDQVSALLGCSLATFEANRLTKIHNFKNKSDRIHLDLGAALKKQERFNNQTK